MRFCVSGKVSFTHQQLIAGALVVTLRMRKVRFTTVIPQK